MSKPNDENLLNDKLDEIRRRLTGSPSYEELNAMQLHLDLLERWARVSNAADADHQHNHMADHDNTAFVEPFVVLASKETLAREK
jgi:hypothetical protein